MNFICFSRKGANSSSRVKLEYIHNFNYGIYNLGANGQISKYDLAYKFSKIFDKSHLIINSTSNNRFKVKRSKDMTMDSSLFEKTFNHKMPSIENETDYVFKEYLAT